MSHDTLKTIACFAITLLFFHSPAIAQPTNAPGSGGTVSDGITYYTNKPSFLIPFKQDTNDWRINTVFLYFSEDFGKTFRVLANAQPNQQSFPFRATHDGWYWFAVQTLDKQGRYTPSNMTMAAPGLKVCVDTTLPQIYLKGTVTSAGAATIDWEIRDDNTDPASVRLETRASGGSGWSPLSAQPLANGTHAWNAGPGQFEVHFSVRDKAGNLGEQTLLMVPGQTKTAGVQTAALGPNNAQNAGLPPNVLMVHHRKFNLNFQLEDVGQSGVSRVEVWFTRDGGRTWRKFDSDAKKDPPCTLEVPEEGRYGFTLIACSGVETSEPRPKPGDLPHIWVEVDETKPQLRLLSHDVGRGIDQGYMTLVWTAADKFLGTTPISFSYGTTADGPWTLVKNDISNSGRYVWKMPDQGLPFQFFLKLECTDQAGNTAVFISPSSVKVDLATPRARVVGATAVGIAPDNGGTSGNNLPGAGSGSGGTPGSGVTPGQGTNPGQGGGTSAPGGTPEQAGAGGLGRSGAGAGNSANPNPMVPAANPSGGSGGNQPGGGSANGPAGGTGQGSANPLPGAEIPKAPATGQPSTGSPASGAPGTSTSTQPMAPAGLRAQPLPSGTPGAGNSPNNPTGSPGEIPALPTFPPPSNPP